MEELMIGQKVIHSGMEKKIDEIHGDVLILSDDSVVTRDNISIVEESTPQRESENEELRNIATAEKEALRRHIEELNEDSAAVSVFALMQEVDPSITVATLESMTVEAMKKKLLHIAVTTGKISPKKCETCGQIVPE